MGVWIGLEAARHSGGAKGGVGVGGGGLEERTRGGVRLARQLDVTGGRQKASDNGNAESGDNRYVRFAVQQRLRHGELER